MRKKGCKAISGIVRTSTGVPISGVMVMGTDLNYVETNADGYFEMHNPDSALVFWCTGYAPRPQLIPFRTVAEPIEVVLNPLG